MRNPKLKPWLDAGLKRVAINGISDLNVSEIAASLKTAKSSFYHYFNTKEEYLEQLIEYCEEEGTFRIIKYVLLNSNTTNQVQLLLSEVFLNNFENELVLQQLHSSLGQNEAIRKKVEEIEKIRTSFISTLLTNTGLEKNEADRKAKQVYRYFLGTLVHCNLKAPTEDQRKEILEDFKELFGKI